MKLIIINFLLISSLLCVHSQNISSDNIDIVEAFNLAKQTVDINTRRGLLAAGGDYGGEWTRDIAINSMFGASLLRTEVAENSLWSVTINKDTIGHQYWDKIIWATAALNHYKVSGNIDFLKKAYSCIVNTINELEKSQFDSKYGLFNGPSVFNDGIAGYPSNVYDKNINLANVLEHKNTKNIKCLSTNSIYYNAYKVLAEMGKIVNANASEINEFQNKANQLKANILKYLYNKTENRLYYLVDHTGKVDTSEERLGISFAVIFGIIEGQPARELIKNIKQSAFGVTSIYPDFEGFTAEKPGRHNNIIWPMVNGFFAQAATQTGNRKAFDLELTALQKLALDEDKGNYNYWEIYNSTTGKPDGGWQASNLNVSYRYDEHWTSKRYQTWSAMAYVNMILHGVLGLRYEVGGIAFQPYLSADCKYIELKDIPYRNAKLSVRLTGTGSQIKSFKMNGKIQKQAFIPAGLKGKVNIEIVLI